MSNSQIVKKPTKSKKMIKKTRLGLSAGIIGVVAAAWITASNINTTPEMSDLMIKNIEMLTQGESLVQACDYWCWDSPYSTCGLLTNAGFEITCWHMYWL
jgi:hypothetical protein